MARVTLLDVARHCGVSRATVSLVVNDSPLVAESTRATVKQSMEDLGYVYNRSAASLRTQRTNTVGVVLTQITNPYFAEFAAGLQDALAERDAVALLAISNEDIELQATQIRSLVERGVDGIVVIPAHGTTAADMPDRSGVPTVLLARRVDGLEADFVGAVNHGGAHAAAAHLWDHGCRRIAFFGGYADSSARAERLAGVAGFLHEQGLELTPAMSPTTQTDRLSAYRAAMEFLASTDVDGVVCFSDMIAFGVLDALADLGRRVGTDARVIGFDDVLDAAYNRPSVSSVAVPARATGHRAGELVLSRADGGDGPVVHEELPTRLEPRESCGCPRPVH